jgi:hypothetical protein
MDQSDGMFWAAPFNHNPRPPTRIQDVEDGTSRTLMIGESVFLVDRHGDCQICDRFYLYHPNADSGDGIDFSEALGSTFYRLNPRTRNQRQRECAFSSFHPQGVVGALADGSTTFFHNDIELKTWRALGSIARHELVAP